MSFDTVMNALALRQDGCVARAQALARGVSSEQWRRAAASARWVEVMPDVVVSASTPLTLVVRERAALLWWGEDAALSDFSAGRIHRLGVRESRPADVWIAVAHRERHRRRPPSDSRVHVHHTRHLESERLWDGRKVTPAARTLVDLARYVDHDLLAAAYLTATQRDLCSVDDVVDRADLVRGRGGSALARAVAREFDPAFESILGAEMHAAFALSGLPLDAGRVLALSGGELIRPDGYDEVLRVIVEADGFAWHGSAEQIAADKARDRRALAAGLLTLRYDTRTIRRRAPEMVADYRAVSARRAVDLGLAHPLAA